MRAKAADFLKTNIAQLTTQRKQITLSISSGQQGAGQDDYALEQTDNKLARYNGLYGLFNRNLDADTAAKAARAAQKKIRNLEDRIAYINTLPVRVGDSTYEVALRECAHQLTYNKSSIGTFLTTVRQDSCIRKPTDEVILRYQIPSF